MAIVCDVCGHKTNNVKSGGGIEKTGARFEVRSETKDDPKRDVLKSETCSLSIPELVLEVGPTALGGRFTTVEGILVAMRDQLEGNGIIFHDSSDEASKAPLQKFVQAFEEIVQLKKIVTLVCNDLAGNSSVQSLRDEDDDEPDGKLKTEHYERNENWKLYYR